MPTCPRCKTTFMTPEGEWQDHPCPRCNWLYDEMADPLDDGDAIALAEKLYEDGTPSGRGEEWYVDTIEMLAEALHDMVEANRETADAERERRNRICLEASP